MHVTLIEKSEKNVKASKLISYSQHWITRFVCYQRTIMIWDPPNTHIYFSCYFIYYIPLSLSAFHHQDESGLFEDPLNCQAPMKIDMSGAILKRQYLFFHTFLISGCLGYIQVWCQFYTEISTGKYFFKIGSEWTLTSLCTNVSEK